MIYFPSVHLGFYHIHKTGGTSFKHGLRSLFPECIELDPFPHHWLPVYYAKLREMGVEPETAEILTSIRDPLDHVVSIYHYWRQYGNPDDYKVQAAKQFSFSDFIDEHLRHSPEGQPYIRCLCVDGRIPPNVKILRLESWRADLQKLNYPWGPRFQLPRLNVSEHEPAINYWDARSVRLIRNHYSWVYEAGYYPEPALMKAS